MTHPAPADPKAAVLHDVFGYTTFRGAQAEIIDAVLAGESVLAVMPTGSGKSMCYQIPALMAGGLTIVVSPLVALMQDQVAALEVAGVAAGTINSSRPREDNVATWRRAAAGELSLLYMAPERLMTERMLSALSRLPVKLFAVDEAHCISQWGPAFRPEYEALSALRQHFPGTPVVALTATADDVTRSDIAARLFGGAGRIFVSGFDRPNISLAVEMKRNWQAQLLAFLADRRGDSGIVYCLSRRKTEETAALLVREGYPALAYHAGMDREDRIANHRRFLDEPGTIVVATIAFGMGIDKPDVRFVFHTDIPGSVEAYYQEIGRAGRDGEPADAHMLYGLDDLRMRRLFIEDEDTSDERRRREHKRLDALVAYCEAPECRRETLLAYFDETPEACGNCDLCLNPVERVDGTAEAAAAITAVRETGERFGASHVIDVLRGADNAKVREFGHDRHEAYGAGRHMAKDAWRSILRQLVAAGFLKLDVGGYGGLSLTPRGRRLAAGDETFSYRPDTVAPAKRTPRKARATDIVFSGEDADLLGRLKSLRTDLARERGVPPYVIFPDRALEDMVARRPASRDEFAEVHGVGDSKLRDFATPFLAAIAAG